MYSYAWNDRKQFGQLIGSFQGMQHQIAQAYTEISAARGLLMNAARKKEAGEEFVRDAAMAKLFASQVAGRVSGQAIEWMGGMVSVYILPHCDRSKINVVMSRGSYERDWQRSIGGTARLGQFTREQATFN